MMLEGDWLRRPAQGERQGCDEYGIFPFPTGTDRLYGFGEYNYISAKSKNPDAAAKFLDYLASDAVQQAHLGEFGSISVNKNVKYENVDAAAGDVDPDLQHHAGPLRERRPGLPARRDHRVLADHQRRSRATSCSPPRPPPRCRSSSPTASSARVAPSPAPAARRGQALYGQEPHADPKASLVPSTPQMCALLSWRRRCWSTPPSRSIR